MSKTAPAGEQEAVGRKIFKRRREAFTNDFRGFQHIAALVDHAERQGTFEIPLLPQLHQIVSERAVLERDFIDLHSAEGRHEVAIQPGNLLRVAGRSGWRDDTFPSIAETSPGHRRKGGQAGPLSNLGELLGQQGATSKGCVPIAQKAGSKAKSRILNIC